MWNCVRLVKVLLKYGLVTTKLPPMITEPSRRYQYRRGDLVHNRRRVFRMRELHIGKSMTRSRPRKQVHTKKSKGVQQTPECSPKCYNCAKADHLTKNCKAQKSEISGPSLTGRVLILTRTHVHGRLAQRNHLLQ